MDALRERELAKWILAGQPLLSKSQYQSLVTLVSPRRRPPPIPEREVEAAIRAAQGIISAAADRLGIHRNTLFARIQRSKKLQAITEDCRERILDFAEGQLLKNIRDGDPGSVYFILKTLGKKRGFIERHQIEALQGQRVGVLLIPGTLSIEDWDRMAPQYFARHREVLLQLAADPEQKALPETTKDS